MTNKQKPRQFWIRPRKITKGPTWNCTDNLMKYAGHKDIIHVIEYSAYQALQADIQLRKDAYDKLDDINIKLNERIKELEQEIEKLRKEIGVALGRISNDE